MPWIRYIRAKYVTPLAPHVALCASGRRYVWTGEQAGVVDVPFKADVDELLNPPGDQGSVHEVAWERYGVTFDADGKELLPPPVSVNGSSETTTGDEPEAPRRGRPPKR